MAIITPPASWTSSQILCEKKENSLYLKKRTTPYYIIIPIFEATIEDTVLNKSIYGYKFISSEQFHKEYSEKLYDADNLLENDIQLPVVGKVVTRPISRYVLIKEIELSDITDEKAQINNENKLKKEFDFINNLITSFHLLQSGSININKVYVLSDNSSTNYMIKSSTSLYEIKNNYFLENKYFYHIRPYSISLDITEKIMRLIVDIFKVGDKYTIPLFYFNKYFSSYDIIDKLINLSIVWESTILANQRKNLRSTLARRGSCLLHQNLSDILKLAYDLRSEIVHNGNISNKTLNKIKNSPDIMDSMEEDIDFGVLFNFLIKYLEPITRTILVTILLELSSNDLTLDDLLKNLDL